MKPYHEGSKDILKAQVIMNSVLCSPKMFSITTVLSFSKEENWISIDSMKMTTL